VDLTPLRIGGLAVGSEGDGRGVTEVRSPWDGRLVGRVPLATATDIDEAVAVAGATLEGRPLPAHERASILERAALAVTAQRLEFAATISAESAKPITTALGEVDRTVDTFRFAAVAARTLVGEVIPLDATTSGAGRLGFTLRVPIGVVAAISSFNFPLNLVVHKVAPAIAAGCPVVLKPADKTPLTALLLERVLTTECGLPPGWLSVVNADTPTAEHLVRHRGVALVSFTGSVEVGWHIRAVTPRARVCLELGNNAPVLVDADADVADVARRVATAGFSFAGQSCISVQRVYVQRDIAGAFTDALAAATEALVVGDPADPATDVSAVINVAAAERIGRVVDDAVVAGARPVCGGGPRRGTVVAPTVLDAVTNAMDVARTEVFGPVVGVAAVADMDEAIALANDTTFGLQAGIFTRNLDTALDAARRLRFGGVLVNEVPTWRADQMPYGGVEDSGNTREGPAWTVREMTTERLVVVGG
jgi:acyl-CoA reductase-like NAD-dependent aldehyde dehydrogenase